MFYNNTHITYPSPFCPICSTQANWTICKRHKQYHTELRQNIALVLPYLTKINAAHTPHHLSVPFVTHRWIAPHTYSITHNAHTAVLSFLQAFDGWWHYVYAWKSKCLNLASGAVEYFLSAKLNITII